LGFATAVAIGLAQVSVTRADALSLFLFEHAANASAIMNGVNFKYFTLGLNCSKVPGRIDLNEYKPFSFK